MRRSGTEAQHKGGTQPELIFPHYRAELLQGCRGIHVPQHSSCEPRGRGRAVLTPCRGPAGGRGRGSVLRASEEPGPAVMRPAGGCQVILA